MQFSSASEHHNLISTTFHSMDTNEDEAIEEAYYDQASTSDEDDPAIQTLGRKYAAYIFCEVFRWIYGNGTATKERMRKNARVAAFCILPELKNESQVKLAAAMGLRTKQDLDRSLHSFCETFGFTRAMQHGVVARTTERAKKAVAKLERDRKKELARQAAEPQYQI